MLPQTQHAAPPDGMPPKGCPPEGWHVWDSTIILRRKMKHLKPTDVRFKKYCLYPSLEICLFGLYVFSQTFVPLQEHFAKRELQIARPIIRLLSKTPLTRVVHYGGSFYSAPIQRFRGKFLTLLTKIKTVSTALLKRQKMYNLLLPTRWGFGGHLRTSFP